MNRNLTYQVIGLGNNELSKNAMRERRAELLNTIQVADESGKEIPETEMRQMLSELYDLNIAIGDVALEDKDGDNE